MATTNFKQNLPYVKQQFSAALGNSSVVVKFLCISVFIGYLSSFSYTLLNLLCVIPGNVLPPNFWYWTFLSYPFIETHIWNLLVDVIIIVLYGKLLEPLWGAKEMLIFFIVVTLIVAIVSTCFYLVLFLLMRSPDYLFYTKLCGLAGYIGAFTVAVKQTMPDHVLINSPFGKLRNKHVPVSLFIFAIIARVFGIVMEAYPVMFGIGILTSWVYLRFYQRHTNGNKGDMADSFSFSSFFPEALQPVIAVISNSLFSCLVKVKLCKKAQRSYDISAPTTITVSLPGTDPQHAERRRQLALKALNERLSKVQKSAEDSEWPSLEQDPESSPSNGVEPPSGTTDTPATHSPLQSTAPPPANN